MPTNHVTTRGVAVVAIGGNALVLDDSHKTVPDQFLAAKRAMKNVADIVEAGWEVVLTHGNGPQVGYILRRSELALDELHPVPMDYAGADTQGAIGYMFQKALRNEFVRRGIPRNVITVVTQVKVSSDDNAFVTPTKPIGSYMAEDHAKKMADEYGWSISEEDGFGWRRVVPSPYPEDIIEFDLIRGLVGKENVVIACGGGGIPVVERRDGTIKGVEAVVDKDYASCLLARKIKADVFIVTTNVDRVAINYGKENEFWLDRTSIPELKNHRKTGQFPEGSMGPKVDSVIRFVEAGGQKAIITDIDNLAAALQDQAGTMISADG